MRRATLAAVMESTCIPVEVARQSCRVPSLKDYRHRYSSMLGSATAITPGAVRTRAATLFVATLVSKTAQAHNVAPALWRGTG